MSEVKVQQAVLIDEWLQVESYQKSLASHTPKPPRDDGEYSVFLFYFIFFFLNFMRDTCTIADELVLCVCVCVCVCAFFSFRMPGWLGHIM